MNSLSLTRKFEAGGDPADRSLSRDAQPGLWKWIRLSATACLLAGAGSTMRASNGPPQHYVQTNLVADVEGVAPITDPRLVNPWGLSRSAAGPWWVADNGTGLSTLYNGTGVVQALVVTLPNLPGITDPSAPTGTVFNAVATDFLLGPGRPARFLFVTEEGTLLGWNSGTTATLVVNNSGTAVYKGLAIATMGGAQYLYAANFLSGAVDVFDRAFNPVNLGPNAFRDPTIPSSYRPFNVQTIGASIYVTFAQKEEGSIDDVQGPGRGYVSVFSPAGVLEKRLRWGAWFNAPWGVALAPADFGGFSNLVLVGQFGSGKIAAFDPVSGEFRGYMRGEHGKAIAIDGLWALDFGNGGNAGPTNVLYFTAGTEDEAHGLFGTLTPAADKDHGGGDEGDEHGDD